MQSFKKTKSGAVKKALILVVVLVIMLVLSLTFADAFGKMLGMPVESEHELWMSELGALAITSNSFAERTESEKSIPLILDYVAGGTDLLRSDLNGHTAYSFYSPKPLEYSTGHHGGLFGVVGEEWGWYEQKGNFGRCDPFEGEGYDENIKIRNLTLKDVSISGSDSVGALAGRVFCADISNVHVEGGQVIGNNSVGGLVGKIGQRRYFDVVHPGAIHQSSSNVNVDAFGWDCYIGFYTKEDGEFRFGSCAGGLVGKAGGITEISESYSSGDVYGEWLGVGGLIGQLGFKIFDEEAMTVERSYATGDVRGAGPVGGLIGIVTPMHLDLFYSNISETYATGRVREHYNIGWDGGLLGRGAFFENDPKIMFKLEDSYWDSDTTGQNRPFTESEFQDEFYNVKGFETENMTYGYEDFDPPDDDDGPYYNWDLTDSGGDGKWYHDEDGGYPILAWEEDGGKTEDLDCEVEVRYVEQLDDIREDPDKAYCLVNDLDLCNYTDYEEDYGENDDLPHCADDDGEFDPIGTMHEPFTGSFDGQGNTIKNLNSKGSDLYTNRCSDIISFRDSSMWCLTDD